MQMPIFLTKLSDESIIFISDVGKKSLPLKTACMYYHNIFLLPYFSQLESLKRDHVTHNTTKPFVSTFKD
jgi:hypothetical protein